MHAVHTAISFPLICRFAYVGTDECRMLKVGATVIEVLDNERSSLPGTDKDRNVITISLTTGSRVCL